jgi:hypothetical protein
LDAIIIGTLVLLRPNMKSLRENTGGHLIKLGLVIRALATILLFSGIVVGTACFGFGSVRAAIAYFRGERISIEPGLLDLGEAFGGEVRDGEVTLTNWSNGPVQIIGGTSDCSCSVLADLPITIPANESRTLSVKILFNGAPGSFTRKVDFIANDAQRIDFRVTGTVKQPTSK